MTIEFRNGKVAFYDFADVQYHSGIRTRQLTVQGTRGEIDDLTIRYLKPDNEAVYQELFRQDIGVFNNQEWYHRGIWLGDKPLYENPLGPARLNDDEIAVATCLLRMGDYVDTSRDFYSIRDALQDTYISLMIEAALRAPGSVLESSRQSWMED